MPNSVITRSGECKKFSPNIFNKTKCANCFRQKEEHSVEALESNRACRKVAKCGYLFVAAPGWDFTNPLNRTKRWQRRWFVLYDDGELSYSVDEHPETIPQACIDMNKVLDVTEAEELTGNAYSLAITAHDGIHFVKAGCREEARWWMDVLSVFPRSKQSRHKRSATFPKPSSGASSVISPAANGPSTSQRTSGAGINRTGVAGVKDVCTRYIWSSEESLHQRNSLEVTNAENRKSYLDIPRVCASDVQTSKLCSDIQIPRICSEDTIRNRRILSSRENRSVKSDNGFSDLSPLPNWKERKSSEFPRRLIIENFNECKLKDVTDSVIRMPRSRRSSSSVSSTNPESDHVASHRQVRGDPDGCGLDLSTFRYSPSSELRVDSVSDDMLHVKKGWLMKQGCLQDQEWNKHWFVLRSSALLYYRDPTAEDQGILDGVIDLSVMNNITEVQVSRNYGFQIMTWDDKRYTLSAVTSGIRVNWMAAIKKAAGLQDDISVADTDKEVPSTPRSLLLSSDDEYRTASENGRMESSSDWGETLPPSPPLNRTPISRVKERARGVTRTRVYNSRNSKSSPPSSRHSTIDSLINKRQDLLPSCAEVTIQDKTERSLLLKKLEKQGIELEDVKRQLTSALRQLSSAEEELLRLRQRQRDVASLEKEMEDMMRSLQKAEETLKQKSCEMSEYETFKKRYAEEKASWEEELRVTECELHETEERYSELCCELASSREHVEKLRNELTDVSDRLARGIEENESLYRRLHELENRADHLSLIRESKARSLDSLSDLTNISYDLDVTQLDKERIVEEYEDVKRRFEKAVQEIRAMRRELKASHAQNDCLEISLINAKQELKCKQDMYESQASMMADRIQDLTAKLLSAEKQVRSLKQKFSKVETREKRRSLSLKGRESYAMCKELEEKLSILEKKISLLNGEYNEAIASSEKALELQNLTCSTPVASNSSHKDPKIRRKSLDSATGPEPMKILIRMTSLESKVAEVTKKVVIKPSSSFEDVNNAADCAGSPLALNEVKNIESLLRKKLVETYSKQKSLHDAGLLSDEVKLNIMAEKLAYESVLISRLREVVAGGNDSDLADAERLMSELEKKLNGQQVTNKTSIEYFATSLSQYLIKIGRASEKDDKVPRRKKNSLLAKSLQKKSAAISKKVNSFINEHIDRLCSMLVCSTNKDVYIKDLTAGISDTAGKHLIEFELSHIVSHCTNIYETLCAKEKETAFHNLMVNRANLEHWTDNVLATVDQEINGISKRIREKLAISNKMSPSPVSEQNIRQIVQQLIDVVSHKVLLDARISTIADSTFEDLKEVSKLDEATIVAEVQFLYSKLHRDLQFSNEEKKVFDSLDSVGSEISALYNSVEDLVKSRSFSETVWDAKEQPKFDDSNSSTESSWLDGVCRRCSEIKEQIINLQTCLSQNQECQKCLLLSEQFRKKEEAFEEQREHLEEEHRQLVATMQANFENDKKLLISKHEQEETALRERARKLEKRLDVLDSGHNQQTDNLRAIYGSRLPSSGDLQHCNDEESFKTRYQTEIEQLRALCEKGLAVMDSSHRRIIAELEERHQQEIESLKRDKEQALAEETQATLAALDAMRKAHEADVKKEVEKFKNEYVKKLQSSNDIKNIHKDHQVEMEEIKKEILTLSEKYSMKCVESAGLEEELRVANNQLAQAHHHIMQLDSRNKQLRAHILSEVEEGGKYQGWDMKNKETAELQNKLMIHDVTLKALYKHLNSCEQLEQTASLNSLLDNFRDFIKAFGHFTGSTIFDNISKEVVVKNVKCKSSKDQNDGLKWKQSYPNTSPRRSVSPSIIRGVVAERKKIFET